jgi:hypothetical protein
MWRKILIFFIGGGLGAGIGFAAGIFVYPYIFLADQVAMDPALSGKVVARGTFIHADKNDPVHYGSGKVTVYGDALRLQADFEVGPGPKFHVYLVPKAMVRNSGDVKDTMYVDLGRLRAFKGAQNYRIPKGVDLSKFKSVVIWCEAFGVLISPADLTFGS